MDWMNIAAFILSTIAVVFTFLLIWKDNHNPEFNVVRFIARVAIFGAMSTILYAVPFLKFSIPGFPSFLELHFDEVPALIAGFAYGPFAGFAVILIKTVIKLPLTTTVCVGELCDLLLSTVFVVPAAIVYEKRRNLKGVFMGLLISMVLQVVVAMVANVYALIPFYTHVGGFQEGQLLALMQLAMPSISDVGWSYASIAVLPFNLIKDVIVIVLTFLIYRKIHKYLRFDGRKGIKKTTR